ncbi:MAG: hypothetical protein HOK67_18115 [Deltaproteobacteria bacterium]|jgi:uncharacterized membrane protein|nr:hypothetical protein [Deltaproteobacteria bacterium]
MNQDEINESEWKKNENWGGPGWGEIYFSKKDSRIFVPKRLKWLGMTVNLAHIPGVLLFWGALFGIPCVIIAILLATK